ncbi:hypothetical protein, partial [Stutzerimonas stutzeri]
KGIFIGFSSSLKLFKSLFSRIETSYTESPIHFIRPYSLASAAHQHAPSTPKVALLRTSSRVR